MKKEIDSLFGAWVHDNRDYIDENQDIYTYFKLDLENRDNSLYDWGTEEEVEQNKEKLKKEVLSYLEKYIGVTAKEFLYGD